MPATTARPWTVTVQEGSADQLHAASAAVLAGRQRPTRMVTRMSPVRRALVLGSSQAEGDYNAAAVTGRGWDVARRRSGGGAVVVGPEECLWVDLVVPAGDPLWDEDVGRAMWWVGEAWATALTGVGVPAPSVWRGSFQGNEWSGRVCFAGMGPGEVMVGPGKVVGVSQRRTRQGSLFQTAALLKWQPADLAGLLNVDPQSRERAAAELGHRAMGLGPELAEPLWAALVDVLDSGRPPRS